MLKIGDGATPEVFTAIAEVKDINGPVLSREFAEFTHQQSASGYREYKPTFKNSGDVTFKCNFLPDDETQGFQTAGLLKDYEDGTCAISNCFSRIPAPPRRRLPPMWRTSAPGLPSRAPSNST